MDALPPSTTPTRPDAPLGNRVSGAATAPQPPARPSEPHRHAADELEQVRAAFQDILDSMPSILVAVDAACRVTGWNACAVRATGIGAAQARGRPFAELLPGLAAQEAGVRRTMAEGAPVHAQRLATGLRDGGGMRFVDLMAYPLGAGEAGAVIRIDDVTERVHIEQLMVQTEKMMSVGGLAAGMAHEINNPLGVILQSCQNLRRRLGTELPANRRAAAETGLDLEALQRYLKARGLDDFIEAIQDAGERAGRIVADMLAFSRRADGGFAPASAAEMMETAVRLAGSDYDLKRKYDFRQIEVVRDHDPALPPVPCVRTEIEQVLLNLLKNAAQAMAAGGARPSRLLLRTACEDGCARIEVADNGPGIDAEGLRRVFEPFYTTKPPGEGTGLGLSVSYFIVTELHQGRIEVESAPGVGTRFTIRLPLRQPGPGEAR